MKEIEGDLIGNRLQMRLGWVIWVIEVIKVDLQMKLSILMYVLGTLLSNVRLFLWPPKNQERMYIA